MSEFTDMPDELEPTGMPHAAPAPAPAPSAFSPSAYVPSENTEHDFSFINDVEVTAIVELGRTVMPIKDVLKLRRGSVVELDKLVGQPAELMINNTLMAKGEVIVINERFGFRITKFVAPAEQGASKK